MYYVECVGVVPCLLFRYVGRHAQCSAVSPYLQSVLSKFPSAGVLFNLKEESNRFFLAKFQMQQGCKQWHSLRCLVNCCHVSTTPSLSALPCRFPKLQYACSSVHPAAVSPLPSCACPPGGLQRAKGPGGHPSEAAGAGAEPRDQGAVPG